MCSKKEQIILRLNDLSYQSDGQILFDFQESQLDAVGQRSATEWFSAAVEGEDGGNYREAIECYEKAIAADQRFYEAHFNLGNLFRNIFIRNAIRKCLKNPVIL